MLDDKVHSGKPRRSKWPNYEDLGMPKEGVWRALIRQWGITEEHGVAE